MACVSVSGRGVARELRHASVSIWWVSYLSLSLSLYIYMYVYIYIYIYADYRVRQQLMKHSVLCVGIWMCHWSKKMDTQTWREAGDVVVLE